METGDIGRFDRIVNSASCARTVNTRRESNGKKKRAGNAQCGHKHLAWAFIEAAHFAVRYDAAIMAVAHKLARACSPVMKDGAFCSEQGLRLRTPTVQWDGWSSVTLGLAKSRDLIARRSRSGPS